MLTESEILSKHAQCLKEGRAACLELARNADPTYLAPRGPYYKALKDALKGLEGSSRQMSHWRGDARWLKLGVLYAKATRTAQKKFATKNWHAFRDLAGLFEVGTRHMDELANGKTGRSGVILPQRTDWLILPDQINISQGRPH